MRGIAIIEAGLSKTLDKAASLEEFTGKVIEKFREDASLFNEYLFWLFFNRIEKVFASEFDLTKINSTDKISFLLPSNSRKRDLKELEIASGLIMPRPVMTGASFLFLCFLILIPIIIIILMAFRYPELFAGFFEIIIGGGFVIVFVLVFLVHFINPRLLSSNDLPRIKTYNDLVKEVVRLNEHFYQINNFKLAVDELAKEYLNYMSLKKKN